MDDLDSRLANLAQVVFKKPVAMDAQRKDEPAWDSFAHLKLMLAFEGEFGVRVPVDRIEHIQSLRELRKLL